MATVPRRWTWGVRGKGKAKVLRQGPSKVPGALMGAPRNLHLLPRFKPIPWLEPAAAKALRDRVEAEAFEIGREEKLRSESRMGRRG